MQYGFFDNNRKEYVITNPATPTPWINYLGSGDYAALISNNGGGYSFHRSASRERILRYRFNGIPIDRPGRYVYIRDNRDGDFWSPTWQPVAKPLADYSCECRHGLGYSTFTSRYRDIGSEQCVFVPVGKAMEVWEITLTNHGATPRDLSVFAYAEWAFWQTSQDMANFQYILYTCKMGYAGGIIDYSISLWPPYEPKAFMASVLPVESFDTDRAAFVGGYRDEGKALAVEQGRCTNSIASGGTPCGALHNKLFLEPGETKRACFVIGIGDAATQGVAGRSHFSDAGMVQKELDAVRSLWHTRLAFCGSSTPSPLFDTMYNVWNQYQCHTTFHWSRSASFIEAGGRDGLGFRDTAQDTLAVVQAIPDQVRGKLIDLLKGQVSDGSALHHIQPLTWSQGNHNVPLRNAVYSDDHLWLLIAVPAYIKETGDVAFLDQAVPFADQGEVSVIEHLRRAIHFSWNNRGAHGLCLGLAADWNDCLNLKGNGESVWSTFLFFRALVEFIDCATYANKHDAIGQFPEYLRQIRQSLDANAWDGEWFVRGFLDNGTKIGSRENSEGKIFINTQTWALISGYASEARAASALDAVHRLLATPHGPLLVWPAYTTPNLDIGAITSFPAGLKENGSVFCHAATWAIVAEALAGNGDRAYAYYESFLPAAKNTAADLYTAEPYVYSQFITGKEHPQSGRAHNPWLTGAASWAFVAASQYILGIRAAYNGLIIDPCIPRSWQGFTAHRVFRGKQCDVTVKNPHGVSRGVASMIVNNEPVSGVEIAFSTLKQTNTIDVVLGQEPQPA